MEIVLNYKLNTMMNDVE